MKTSLSKQFQKSYRRFKSDPAGKRFENLYRTSQKLKPVVRVGLGVAGFILGLGGLLLGLVPGVPGIVLGAVGFALVAAQFKPVATGADHAEVRTREFWADLRSHFKFLKNSFRLRKDKAGAGRKAGAKKPHRARARAHAVG